MYFGRSSASRLVLDVFIVGGKALRDKQNRQIHSMPRISIWLENDEKHLNNGKKRHTNMSFGVLPAEEGHL